MAGFLDKNNRVVDLILTGLGKSQLSLGKLNFMYWAPFDDEIDYTPYISQSGTMDSATLSSSISDQIENSLITEAVTGYRPLDHRGQDLTNVRKPIFTMPHGQTRLPTMVLVSSSGSDLSLTVDQSKLFDLLIKRDLMGNVSQQLGPFDRGYVRSDSSAESITLSHDGFPPDHRSDGFLIKVLTSGSDGFSDSSSNRDLSNQISFDEDLIFKEP
jgi:hypothetical protein